MHTTVQKGQMAFMAVLKGAMVSTTQGCGHYIQVMFHNRVTITEGDAMMQEVGAKQTRLPLRALLLSSGSLQKDVTFFRQRTAGP